MIQVSHFNSVDQTLWWVQDDAQYVVRNQSFQVSTKKKFGETG